MYLCKLKNGYYYVFYKSDNGKKNKISSRLKHKAEALEFFSEFKEQLKKRNHKDYLLPITLKEFIWEFLKLSSVYHTDKTYGCYKSTLKFFTKFLSPSILLSDITTSQVENYLLDRYQTTSVYAHRKDYINLKAFFNKAIKVNYLKSNPLSRIKRINVPEKLPTFFTQDEFSKLLNVIDKEDVKDLVIFAVNTGLRQSELLNLQFRLVNFGNRTIILDNQTHITKSKRIRSVPLNETAFNIVQKRNDARYQNVFTLRESGIKQDWIVHNFKKYVLKAKLNPKLNFHSLRHTFASWLVQSGISIYEVSKLLGHADIKTTQIYAHLRTDDLRNAVLMLD